MARVRRLALYGEFGCGNLGNEGSLDAFLDDLRRRHPEVQLTCICRCPDRAATRFGVPTTSITLPRQGSRRWARLYALAVRIPGKGLDLARMVGLVGRFDAVVVPGTGILEDSMGTRPWGVPWELFSLALAAQVRRKPLLFTSIGGNRPGDRATTWLFRGVLNRASYRSFRDDASRAAAAGIGVTAAGGDPVFADLAFRLPAPDPLDEPEDGTVAIGVISYYGRHPGTPEGQAVHDRYVTQQVDLVRRLLREGRRVRLLIGDVADQRVADAICEAVSEQDGPPTAERIRSEGATTLHELMLQMAASKVVVASRFHNIVCAALLGRPSISLGHSEKNDSLQDLLGLREYCHHIEDIQPEAVMKQIAELEDGYPDRHRRIDASVVDFRRRLDRQFRDLDREMFGEELPDPGHGQGSTRRGDRP